MRNTGQAGSVLGFILGGVILTTLLIGSVYWLRQKSQQPSVQVPSAPVQQPIQKPSEPSPQPKKEEAKKTNDTPSTLPSDSVPSPSSPSPSQQSRGLISQEQLPQTGPVESIASAFVLALLCGVSLSYLRSRQLSPSL